MYVLSVCPYVCMSVYICMSVCVCMYVCIYVCLPVRVYVLSVYMTGPTKIDHVSTNYTELYFR